MLQLHEISIGQPRRLDEEWKTCEFESEPSRQPPGIGARWTAAAHTLELELLAESAMGNILRLTAAVLGAALRSNVRLIMLCHTGEK